VNKRLRFATSITVLLVTTALFVHYIDVHPSLVTQLEHVSPITLLVLLTLTCTATATLTLILHYSLHLCNASISVKENVLLSIYSSIINFFGPLQSGPGFRAVYLKRRHHINYKDFIRFSLLYYSFFAFYSAAFLFGPSLAWWQASLLLVFVVLGCLVALRYKHILVSKLSQPNVIKLALATLLQVSLVALIYFIELRVVDSHITLKQTIIYTGAANFALFVSLTPGSIGIRESFLLLTHRLHHIPNTVVVGASVIDRAVYLVFLALLFVVVIGVHAKDRLGINQVL
jgi:uncharacterized membrane protein YbhN (UPF0104 family)